MPVTPEVVATVWHKWFGTASAKPTANRKSPPPRWLPWPLTCSQHATADRRAEQVAYATVKSASDLQLIALPLNRLLGLKATARLRAPGQRDGRPGCRSRDPRRSGRRQEARQPQRRRTLVAPPPLAPVPAWPEFGRVPIRATQCLGRQTIHPR